MDTDPKTHQAGAGSPGAAGSADLDAAIGAMLDEWDRLPNDLKWDSDHVRLRAKMEALEDAAMRRLPPNTTGSATPEDEAKHDP